MKIKNFPPSPDEGKEFWRLPRVKQKCGLAKSTIYAEIASGKFPKPLRVSSRSVAWLSCEIMAWIELKISERGKK